MTTLPDSYWHDTAELCDKYYESYVDDHDPAIDGEMLSYEEWCDEYGDRVDDWHADDLADVDAAADYDPR